MTDARIAELEARIAELGRELKEAKKPRIAKTGWHSDYDFLEVMPSELVNDGRHPDVVAYEAMRERYERTKQSSNSARARYDRAADILDAAILEILRSGEDHGGVIDRYRNLMRDIVNGKA